MNNIFKTPEELWEKQMHVQSPNGKFLTVGEQEKLLNDTLRNLRIAVDTQNDDDII